MEMMIMINREDSDKVFEACKNNDVECSIYWRGATKRHLFLVGEKIELVTQLLFSENIEWKEVL